MTDPPNTWGPEYDDREVHTAGTAPGVHAPEPPFEGPLHALSRAAWQVVLLTGVASLILGVLVLVWPGASLAAAGVLFGLYLLVSGIFQLVSAFGTHRTTSLRVLAFISGALSIMLGLFCFRGPCSRSCCSRCGSASAGSSAGSPRPWPACTTRPCPPVAGRSSSGSSRSSPASS